MNSSEVAIRDRIYQIASKHNYKRLAKATQEGSFDSVISELMKYKKRNKILQELFEGSFLGEEFAEFLLGQKNPETLEEILKTAGELVISTQDEDICKKLIYFTHAYSKMFSDVIGSLRHIAHYTKDRETVKQIFKFVNDYLFAFEAIMRELCSFNFYDSERNELDVHGGFSDRYFESSEELAKAVKYNLETYQIALADFKGRAYTPKYYKGECKGTLQRILNMIRRKPKEAK